VYFVASQKLYYLRYVKFIGKKKEENLKLKLTKMIVFSKFNKLFITVKGFIFDFLTFTDDNGRSQSNSSESIIYYHFSL